MQNGGMNPKTKEDNARPAWLTSAGDSSNSGNIAWLCMRKNMCVWTRLSLYQAKTLESADLWVATHTLWLLVGNFDGQWWPEMHSGCKTKGKVVGDIDRKEKHGHRRRWRLETRKGTEFLRKSPMDNGPTRYSRIRVASLWAINTMLRKRKIREHMSESVFELHITHRRIL